MIECPGSILLKKLAGKKDKRMRIINEKRRKTPLKTGEISEEKGKSDISSTLARVRGKEIPDERSESNLPMNCTLKSQNDIIGHIQGRKFLSVEENQTDEIYPCEGKFGVYYRFEQHNNAILTKSKNGAWLLKEKINGKYRVLAHVSKEEGKMRKLSAEYILDKLGCCRAVQ